MGVICKARQTGLNRTVALKMVLNTSQATPAALVRFLNEVEHHQPNQEFSVFSS
jgi:hypothetical protein